MRVFSIKSRIFLSLAIGCSVVACTHNIPAPVSELSDLKYSNINRPFTEQHDYYIVKPGDTLFSIAWYYSLDHREVAKNNQIKNDKIYPGQKISLNSPVKPAYFNAESLIEALNREVLKMPVKRLSIVHSEKVGNKLPKTQTYSKKSTRSSTKIASSSQASRIPQKIIKFQSNSSPTTRVSKLNFIWPTEGKVIERFSTNSNANRGVDIAASRGQAVRATAPGRVVYKGNGLRGYGNLVIIKHDNDYLSAYAHNAKVHVTENEFVKAGQRIADIGSSGTQREKLHFEIRYKGKPVDPLNYLPEK